MTKDSHKRAPKPTVKAVDGKTQFTKKASTWPFCGEFACSSFVCVGSLQVRGPSLPLESKDISDWPIGTLNLK